MKIVGMTENNWYAWYSLAPNRYGLTHIEHDKNAGKWFFVHATTCRIPAKYDGGIISAIVEFIT